MNYSRLWLLAIVMALASQRLDGQRGLSAFPLTFSSGCELDLNGDKKDDRAMLIGRGNNYDLVVLLQREVDYQGIVLTTRTNPVSLACVYGFTIRERASNPARAKSYRTTGTYLELSQPEGATAAYFWNQGEFREVWLSD